MPRINAHATGHVVAQRLNRHREVIQTLEFDNDFLNVGMEFLIRHAVRDNFGGSARANMLVNQINTLFLGTGTTEPTPVDAGLESRSGTLAGKQAEGHGGYPADFVRATHADTQNHLYWSEITFTFRYSEGEAEGVWTELGLANDLNYTNPITRALFRDDTGAATSLTILSDEYLEVKYTIRIYDGVGVPATGSITLDGSPVGYSLIPVPGNGGNGWLSKYGGGQGYLKEIDGLYTFFFPFANVKAYKSGLNNLEASSFGYNSIYYATTQTKTFDDATLSVTHSFVFDPTTEDKTIVGLLSCAPHSFSGRGYERGLYVIKFDTPITKKADYRLTLEITASFGITGDPVANLSVSVTTSSSLDFTWDAYPDATEYVLVLRQAGTEIATQTVTAPATTASFTGLTAATEYHLDIQPVTAGRDGVRSIHAATTGAA